MADYPALDQYPGSQEVIRDPVIVDYARSGDTKLMRLQAAATMGFVVEHRNLTTAQRDTLKTFFTTNRSNTFNFWWLDIPGTIYVVAFADQNGLSFRRGAGILWDATVNLTV
jgi:hypothetical protein